jgi:hypothetical protein
MSECWFLKCDRAADGVLYGENGFAVDACEQHATTAVSFGAWDHFTPKREGRGT